MILKAYKVSVDITSGLIDVPSLNDEIEASGNITGFVGVDLNSNGDDFTVNGSVLVSGAGLDAIVLAHTGIPIESNEDQINMLDFSLQGIYAQPGTTYASIPVQVLIPKRSDISGHKKIFAKLALDYDTDGASTMDVIIENYTDGVTIAASEKNYVNGFWVYGSTNWFEVTAFEGKSLRIQLKRNGGSGSVRIEGASLILKYQ